MGLVNVCTNSEINHYKIDEFRKHVKIVCFYDVTLRKNGTSSAIAAGILVIGLYDFRFKSYGSYSGFQVSGKSVKY